MLTFALSSHTVFLWLRAMKDRGRFIYLGACLIAAVRLAREEKWDNSPRS